MKAKAFTLIMLKLLPLTGILLLAPRIHQVGASGTIYIRADGSVDPDTAPISTLDNVTYTFTDNVYEFIVVEMDNIVVDGAGYTVQGAGSGTGIKLSFRSNVTLRNIRAIWFDYGIFLYYSSNNTLTANKANGNDIRGIFLYYSSNNILSNNTALRNWEWGIDLYSSSNNALTSNVASNNQEGGIVLYSSSNNTLTGNNALNNREWGINLYSSSNNTLTGNNALNSIRGIYLHHSTNNTLTGNNASLNDKWGILLYYSSDNVLAGNNASLNDNWGIELYCSSGNVLASNNASLNDSWGILFQYSSGNVLAGNNVSNSSYGISLYYSSNNNFLTRNNVSNSNYGIYLPYSRSNVLFHNNFVDNTFQTYVTTGYANMWDRGYPSGGNYWSDHVCFGDPSDGSQPYNIDEDNIDRYPFRDPNGWLLSQLTVTSSPKAGVTFTIDGVPHSTPYAEWLPEGSYLLEMPKIHTVGEAKYYWDQWSDGDTNPARLVDLDTDVTLAGVFDGPCYELTVASSPIVGVPFTINGDLQTTPYTGWLFEGSYLLEMPETHNEYFWFHWLEDGDISRVKTVTLSGTTYTAVYTTQPIGGASVSIYSEHLSSWIASTLLIMSIMFASSTYFKKNLRRHVQKKGNCE